MIKRAWWSVKHWHPSERDLLLFVNGEGGAKLARKVRNHVDGCWSCSMKRNRLAGAIAAFMRSRESALDGEEFSEEAERRFVSRLRRAANQAAKPPSNAASNAARRKTPGRSSLGIPVQVALAACLLATITGLVWLRFASVPTVSAREILSRAEGSETTRIRAVNNPVVHQVLEVTRRSVGLPSESAYLEFWRDASNDRWKVQTKDARVSGASTSRGKDRPGKAGVASEHAVVVELQEILKSNDMRQNPMSASGFANWCSKLKNPTENVSETVLADGTKTVTVAISQTEPLRKNAIAKAELVVRQQDWHPVEQRLSVSAPNGLRSYDIREAAFEVVTLGSLPASIFDQSIFDQPSLPSPLMVQSSSRRTVTASQGMPVLELEIEVLYRLHRAGACLGEEIRVERGPSERLEVQGFVGTAERKQELRRLLVDLPNVSVLIQAEGPEKESAVRPAVEAPGTIDAQSHASTGDVARSRLDDLLSAYFARLDLSADTRRSKMIEFSNKVISRAQAAQLHAWELRRLAERFGDTALETVSRDSVGSLREIIQEHLRELQSSLGDCNEMLKPILFSPGIPAPSRSTGDETVKTTLSSWHAYCMHIFRSVDPLINDLLGNGQEATRLADGVDFTALARITSEVRMVASQLPGLVLATDIPPGPSTKSLQQAKH
jgi:hypothetical protein